MIWWNKLMEWWKTPKYEVVDRGVELMSTIHIKSGKYKGVVYQYGAVSIMEDPFKIKWSYEIIENPRNLDVSVSNVRLREIQGNILMLFIEQNFTENDMLVG